MEQERHITPIINRSYVQSFQWFLPLSASSPKKFDFSPLASRVLWFSFGVTKLIIHMEIIARRGGFGIHYHASEADNGS